MNFPASGLEASPWTLAALGLSVGILGGAFGVGGSFLAGPALYLLGMRLPFVVGTDLAHIAGKSIVAARQHSRQRQLDGRLAALLVPPTLVGVEAGAEVLEALKRAGETSVVALVYAILLVGLSVLLAVEGALARRRAAREEARGRRPRRERALALAGFLRRRLGPTVWLPVAQVRAPIVAVAATGLVSGFVGGLLGGGAGYVRMPSLVFLLGIPTHVAIGTDLGEIVVSASFGTLTHAWKGNVDFPVALVMLAGGVVGARAGAQLTARLRGPTLRLAFSPLPLAGAALILLRLRRGG